MLLPDFLLTARHAHPNVNSEAEYRQRQAEALAAVQRAYPNLPNKGVHPGLTKPIAFVSGGRWLVECDECGNCPMLAPEWGGLALCYECGAVYEGVEMPEIAQEIERLLVVRTTYAVRYWNPHISLEHLTEENKLMGVGDGVSS